MKKSILDQFANDAINALATVTGGGSNGNSNKQPKNNKQKGSKAPP
jgi:hypothetical protein